MIREQWFSECVADGINEDRLTGLKELGIDYEIDGENIRFYVEIDEVQGTKRQVRVGDDVYYLDYRSGYCFHYALSDSGNFQRGIITELFSQEQWIVFEEV